MSGLRPGAADPAAMEKARSAIRAATAQVKAFEGYSKYEINEINSMSLRFRREDIIFLLFCLSMHAYHVLNSFSF